MGKQLVLISHGLFCEELKKSTENMYIHFFSIFLLKCKLKLINTEV